MCIVGTFPLLNGKGGEGAGGVGPSKNWVTWGAVPKFLLLHSLYVCGKSKVSFITFRFFSLLSWPCKILIQVFIVLKHCIICTFLIYSDSVQKMLTSLFKLVWNTQKKSVWTIFFKYQGKMFLTIKKFLVKIGEEQL